MKLAIIGDIHANLPALQAVLTKIQQQDVDAIISTGDVVGYLPYPNEVIEQLRKHHVLVVQGNHDARFGHVQTAEFITDPKQLQASASFHWTDQTLSAANRSYLTTLPTELRLQYGDQRLRVVHGSHRRNNEYLYPEGEQLAEIAAEIDATIFVSGHTHEAYVRKVAGTTFMNPGSVGKPKLPSCEASYAILTIDVQEVEVALETVAYETTQLRQTIVQTVGIDSKLQELFTNAE